MKGWLTASQKQFVLDHLADHAQLGKELSSCFSFGEESPTQSLSIHFPAFDNPLDLEQIIWIDEIPVLYPDPGRAESFYTLRDKQLIFHHDLLKSAFHLLSGYEELRKGSLDQYGRFPYNESLPFKLGITGKPVVNYYFSIILEGFENFARENSLPFRRDPALKKPVLMVSHDIDRTHGYGFFETGFRFKQLLGLAESTMSRKETFKDACISLFHFLNPFSRKDPYWTFETLMKWEEERSFRGSYYFLEKDGGRNENSRYMFHEKRFVKLFRNLSGRGHEVGIHGTLQSAIDQGAMDRTVGNLRKVSPEPVAGIRQHYLKFKPGTTGQIQEKAGLKYDASLGFAEHDGFRNSYCWPFRLYDFANDRIMDLWEIPLTVMEGTHFYYRKLDLAGSRTAIENLVDEVCKFNGVFSLLWHNHFFEEREIPGITKHYTGILDLCKEKGMEGLTGHAIQKKMEPGRD